VGSAPRSRSTERGEGKEKKEKTFPLSTSCPREGGPEFPHTHRQRKRVRKKKKRGGALNLLICFRRRRIWSICPIGKKRKGKGVLFDETQASGFPQGLSSVLRGGGKKEGVFSPLRRTLHLVRGWKNTLSITTSEKGRRSECTLRRGELSVVREGRNSSAPHGRDGFCVPKKEKGPVETSANTEKKQSVSRTRHGQSRRGEASAVACLCP